MSMTRDAQAHPLLRGWLFGALMLLGMGMLSPLAVADQTRADQASSPEALIEQTTHEMLTRLKTDHDRLKAHPDQLYALVNDIVLPHFDFVYMSHWVLGRSNWAQMSNKQKTQFVLAFRTLLVRTYATALLQYTNQKVKFLPLQGNPAQGNVVVRSKIVQSEGQSVGIYYSLYNKRGKWLVYDVSVDGISLLTNYRSSFNSEISQHGIDGLITRLEQHAIQPKAQ